MDFLFSNPLVVFHCTHCSGLQMHIISDDLAFSAFREATPFTCSLWHPWLHCAKLSVASQTHQNHDYILIFNPLVLPYSFSTHSSWKFFFGFWKLLSSSFFSDFFSILLKFLLQFLSVWRTCWHWVHLRLSRPFLSSETLIGQGWNERWKV